VTDKQTHKTIYIYIYIPDASPEMGAADVLVETSTEFLKDYGKVLEEEIPRLACQSLEALGRRRQDQTVAPEFFDTDRYQLKRLTEQEGRELVTGSEDRRKQLGDKAVEFFELRLAPAAVA